LLGDTIALFDRTGIVRERGEPWPTVPWSLTATTADKKWIVVAANDVQAVRSMSGLDIRTGEDPAGVLSRWISELPSVEAEARLRDLGFAASIVQDARDYVFHPHVRARGDVV